VLTINLGDRPEYVRSHLETNPMPGRHVAEGGEDEIVRLYRVFGAPTWFLVDRDGTIVCNDADTLEDLARLAREQVP
jgi:hypothetical protein